MGEPELKHLVINDSPYLVEQVVWDFVLCLSKDKESLEKFKREAKFILPDHVYEHILEESEV